MIPKTPSVAQLHTPEELLDNAETLFATGNAKMMRAAVLEAITSLETFVQTTIFLALNNKLDPLLVQWLQDKTKMDFDSRLSVLTPIAVGQSVDKTSTLWSDYKKAKEIRNKVTHSGVKVDKSDARFVIDTVYAWLSYLGSTVEVEVALMGLKRFIVESGITVSKEADAISLIERFFGETKAALSSKEVKLVLGNRNLRADLILKFGQNTVLIEVKFVPSATESLVLSAVQQTHNYMVASSVEQGVVIIFQKETPQFGFENVVKYNEGKIYVLIVQA
jgi:hypothetical protein